MPSSKPLFYEYLADPDYSFAVANSGFLFRRMLVGNRYRDTTAAYRARIKGELLKGYREFTGFEF